jgi:hypothetical protein
MFIQKPGVSLTTASNAGPDSFVAFHAAGEQDVLASGQANRLFHGVCPCCAAPLLTSFHPAAVD